MCPDGTLFAVDPFPKGKLGFSVQRVIAQGEVNRISNGNVIFLRMKGTDAASSLSGEQLLEFVFIDGDHSYEGLRLDWTDWSKLLSDDGVIALHDSRSTAARPIDGAGSVRFTEEVILNDPGFEVIEAVESLTVLKRARPSQG